MTPTRRTRFLRRLITMSGAIAIVLSTGIVYAADTAPQRVEIDTQPLAEALVEIGRQFGVVVVAPDEITAGKIAPAITGAMTANQAIERLLTGSGLVVNQTESGAFVVALETDEGNSPLLTDDGPIALGSIVIQGDRQFKSPVETASSVTVITDTQLERTPGARTIDDIVARIPNISDAGFGDEAPVIRGIRATGPTRGAGAAFGGFRPRGTLVVDGRPLSFWEYGYGGTSIYDIDQIEVYRGPQTSAQGVNSIAGASYIFTKDPTFDFESGGKLEFGNRNTRQLAGFVSGPIIEEELAFRLTADIRQSETFLDFDTDVFDDANDLESLTLRGKLLWEPAELPGFSAQLTLSHSDNQAPRNNLVIEPFEDLVARDADSAGKNEREADAGILDLAYEFSPGTEVTSRFVYSKSDVTLFTEGFPRPDGVTSNFEGTELSNETILRFNVPNARISGLAGVYYSETDGDERFAFLSPTFEETADNKESLGLFGQLSYQITDRFEITGGLRYQHDSQDREGSFFGVPIDYDETFDEVLPKLELAYDVSDDTRIGFTASEGFNPGGFTLDFATFTSDEYDEETVWNYELFIRSSLLDGRLNIAGNLFFADWSGFQKFTTTGFDPITSAPAGTFENVDAESYGLEVSAEFAMTRQWTLYGSLGLLETSFDELVAPGVSRAFEFAQAPGYTVFLGIDYRPIDHLALSTQVRHSDDYFSDDSNDPLNRVAAFTTVDVAARYEFGEGAVAYAYVENVFDDINPTLIFQQGGGSIATVTTPRTLGVGFEYSF